MEYCSTRDFKLRVKSKGAILAGSAPDGGLFVPTFFPKLNQLSKLLKLDYQELAEVVLACYLTDFSAQEITDAVQTAYQKKKFPSSPLRLIKRDNLFFLELMHGPSGAFKDLALSIFPSLCQGALLDSKKQLIILTATSGDTGSACLEALKNNELFQVFVFYPQAGISDIQKLQMTTQKGDNIFVMAIEGDFDQAQKACKKALNDQVWQKQLQNANYLLSSANSINLGRLLPQVIYYYYAYLQLVRHQEINLGAKINFVVPTGNFGNILAGFYAKKMGLPINKLICATNANGVLADFFQQGIFQAKRKLLMTSAPAMDILVASNLERLLFHVADNDSDLITTIMNELTEFKCFNFNQNLIDYFWATSIDDPEIAQGIAQAFFELDYLIDPHTSAAFRAYQNYYNYCKDQHKTIILATATPFKFPRPILSSLNYPFTSNDDIFLMKDLSDLTKIAIPHSLNQLAAKKVYHHDTISVSSFKQAITARLKEVKQ